MKKIDAESLLNAYKLFETNDIEKIETGTTEGNCRPQQNIFFLLQVDGKSLF